MKKRPALLFALGCMAFSLFAYIHYGSAQPAGTQWAPYTGTGRPAYRIALAVDYNLVSFQSTAQVVVPATQTDPLSDVSFFLFANAAGVGGSDSRHDNIAVDQVLFNGQPARFILDHPVLHVLLPAPQGQPFTLTINYHGIVPRGPVKPGGLLEMMGSMSSDLDLGNLMGGMGLGDIGSLMGGGAAAGQAPAQAPAPPKASSPENQDYGLYTYANGVLSLGSFWYPALAVRHNGKWVDEAPSGLGDVAYSEMCDFDVAIKAPSTVIVVAPDTTTTPDVVRANALNSPAAVSTIAAPGAPRDVVSHFVANDVRDFCVIMSDDFVARSSDFQVGNHPVRVTSFTLKQDATKTAAAVDIAGRALQIYSNRFGQYAYPAFDVVEGTIKGGAGGMEFSELTCISPSLYQDLQGQMNDLAGSLGAGNLNQVMDSLDAEAGQAGGGGQTGGKPKAAVPAPETAANPATDMLNGLLGEQKAIFDSIFEETIAHEVGHQWWCIGVGSDSQRDPFADESLTNYSSMIYWGDRYGPAVMKNMMDLHLKQSYTMARMLGTPDAPANLRTSSFNGNLQYGAVVYGKAALYYDALRRAVGDPIFFLSLRQYYARYHDHLAGPRDLMNIIAANAPNVNVAGMYQRWILEAHGDDDVADGHVTTIGDMLGNMLGGLMGGGGGGDMGE